MAEEKIENEELKGEEGRISCQLPDFEAKICRPEKTAIVFLGSETEDVDRVLEALDDLQGSLDMDIGVLDLKDDACEELSEKFKVDRQACQILVFQNCEKVSGISLEGDVKEQVAKLKEALAKAEAGDGTGR